MTTSEMVHALEEIGGLALCSTSREHIFYIVDTLRDLTPKVTIEKLP